MPDPLLPGPATVSVERQGPAPMEVFAIDLEVAG